jgi:hypothetical protein
MIAQPYSKSDLNSTIDYIKKKLVRQYQRDNRITVGKALERILAQPDVKQKPSGLIKDTIEMLRLYENEDKKVKDYLKGYMIRSKSNSL